MLPDSGAPTQLLPCTLASVRATTLRASNFRPRRRQLRDGVAVAAMVASSRLDSSRRLALETSAQSLVEHLRQVIDPSIRSALILCGPPRANQKPVLQLVNRFGSTVVFAKVSWNELTDDLLRAEERALRLLERANRVGFEVPRVLGSGDFGAGRWLALSPVGVRRRAACSEAGAFNLAKAIELTAAEVTTTTRTSPFVTQLLQRAADLPIANDIVTALADKHASSDLTLRAWHGDFVPWNILSGEQSTAVWDWERYDRAVPVGLDRLHYAFQVGLTSGSNTISAAQAVADRVESILPELSPAQARIHFDWYLAEILCRYEHDAHIVHVPALERRVGELAGVAVRRRGD